METPSDLLIGCWFLGIFSLVLLLAPSIPEDKTITSDPVLCIVRKLLEVVQFFWMMFVLGTLVLHFAVEKFKDDIYADELFTWSASIAIMIAIIFSGLACLINNVWHVVWACFMGASFATLGAFAFGLFRPEHITLPFLMVLVLIFILGVFLEFLLARLLGSIHHAVALGLTIVSCEVVVLGPGVDGWVHGSGDFYGIHVAWIIGLTAAKLIIDKLYKLAGCCKPAAAAPVAYAVVQDPQTCELETTAVQRH